jgi:broad specificity phosphatase PhoE
LTPRGQAQAEAVGVGLAARIADGDQVLFQHTPVARVVETARLLRAGLSAALAATGRAERVSLAPLTLDMSLCNVRFILAPSQEPEEPSVLYTTINTPTYMQTVSLARAKFYDEFWTSPDPMGYWLTHDSAGAAETPAVVLARMQSRLRELLAMPVNSSGVTHWIGVTHSGAMRNLLRAAFGADPGEPEFCEVIAIAPGDQIDLAQITYRGQSGFLKLN